MAETDQVECILTLVLDIHNVTKSIQESIDHGFDNGFGLISYPLVDPQFDPTKLMKSNVNNNNKILSNIPFNYSSDSTSSVFQSVYGKIAEWVQFHPSNGSQLNTMYEQILSHQLEWATHLGIYSILLPTPNVLKNNKTEEKSGNDDGTNSDFDKLDFMAFTANYASSIITTFRTRDHTMGIIPIPFNSEGWKLWSSLSILLRNVKTIRPALIIESDIPSSQLMEQWFAEGVQIFLLSNSVFLTNKKGFPVLSRPHQKLLQRFLRWTDTTIILKGDENVDNGEVFQSRRYCQYLRHLRSTCLELTLFECEAKPFWDILQTPLQPLSHNLEYATYETFESDPIKYIQYEKAIIQCLIDLDKKSVNNDDDNDINDDDDDNEDDDNEDDDDDDNDKALVVMVLGAGRGPLVSAALNATNSTGIKMRLYAIEKNPHAVIILKDKNLNLWNNAVNIIEEDMRNWEYTEKAHIIISELLGSFGDNELCPECLDGGQRVLRDDGVCIPYKYTSYLCPITNNSVYSRLKQKPKDFETPYVIHLLRYNLLSTEILKCWSFKHPINNNKEEESQQIDIYNAHNTRYCQLKFKINNNIPNNPNGTILHGFAGYFDTMLYGDISLSIHPETASKEMFSWFPMYFPLINPIKLKNNDNVTICLWRKTDKKYVWYEWCIINPILSEIHNQSARSYKLNL